MAIITAIIVFPTTGVQYDITVLGLFYAICLLSLYGVFNSIDKYAFSLNKTFSIFFYFFFGLAPAVQFKFQSTFYNAPVLNSNDYLKGGGILLIILVLYLVLYDFAVRFFRKKKKKEIELIAVKEGVAKYYTIAIVSFIIFIILIKFNVRTVFFRPPEMWLKYNTNFGLIGYALLLIVRPIPIIVLLQYVLKEKYQKKHVFLLGVIVLLSAFPFSLSRGLLIAYYLPLILVLLPKKIINVYYSTAYFIGIFLIFPALNIFRSSNNTISFGIEIFKTGHFDAFQNFILLINNELITTGRQLSGSILFFVQESFWENRPVGTGHLLAEHLNFNYLNVAMPYFGEGFANFGYLGVLLFLILIVILNAFLDIKFHSKRNTINGKILYLFLLGFEFYLLRGDLMSSIKKSIGFILALILCYYSIKILRVISTFRN